MSALRETAQRLWLIEHADGRLISHAFTPPATLAEIRAWYPDARSIEPEILHPETLPPEGIRDATPERLADTRRTCRQCTELTPAGYCRAAARGELAHAARELRPDPARLHRCAGYRPTAEDADTRAGAQRWLDQPRLRGHAA